MLKYIVRRLLMLPVVMFIVTMGLFFLMLRLPVEQRVLVYIPSVNPHLTEEEWEELVQRQIERYGLDDPFWVQYARWAGNLVQGNWGISPTWSEPVFHGLLERAPITLELALFATIPALALAIGTGSLAARTNGRIPDHLLRSAAFVGWAFPPFILALILMNVFYAWLSWFPPERFSIWAGPIIHSDEFRTYTGMLTIDGLLNGKFAITLDAIRHMVLPGISLALAVWALVTRVMRSSLVEVLRQDYIVTARAKGLRERRVVVDHARRNAMLPVISSTSVVVSLLITGVVVIEVVFNYNGVGRWALSAILQADVPVAVGFAILCCLVTVLTSLLSDILYALADPRVRMF